jgi:bacillithiol system protein YtxJ
MIWEKRKTINEIISLSEQQPVFIFKDSPRCGICRAALKRVESGWTQRPYQNVLCIYVHVLEERALSNAIARQFNVKHESPQVLIIKNGICVYHASHERIEHSKIIQVITGN